MKTSNLPTPKVSTQDRRRSYDSVNNKINQKSQGANPFKPSPIQDVLHPLFQPSHHTKNQRNCQICRTLSCNTRSESDCYAPLFTECYINLIDVHAHRADNLELIACDIQSFFVQMIIHLSRRNEKQAAHDHDAGLTLQRIAWKRLSRKILSNSCLGIFSCFVDSKKSTFLPHSRLNESETKRERKAKEKE